MSEQHNWDADVGRRRILAATATAIAGGLAGCASEDDTVEPVDTTTATTTTDPTTTDNTQTTTEEPDKEFEQIYEEQLERDRENLVENHGWFEEESLGMRDRYIEDIRNTDYDDLGHMMQDVKQGVKDTWGMNNDSQELTRIMRIAAHEDLDIDPDNVRILGRDVTNGGTYTAIFRKDDNDDWVKDLALPFDGEGPYLRHGETDIDERDEAERGLARLWTLNDGSSPATFFQDIQMRYKGKEVPDQVMTWIDQGNDHIVVGDEYSEPALDYTVPAAKKVGELQNFHERETFNSEMELVERTTEAYHNNEEPYLKMEMENGEVTAVPTEEHHGPGNLYGS